MDPLDQANYFISLFRKFKVPHEEFCIALLRSSRDEELLNFLLNNALSQPMYRCDAFIMFNSLNSAENCYQEIKNLKKPILLENLASVAVCAGIFNDYDFIINLINSYEDDKALIADLIDWVASYTGKKGYLKVMKYLARYMEKEIRPQVRALVLDHLISRYLSGRPALQLINIGSRYIKLKRIPAHLRALVLSSLMYAFYEIGDINRSKEMYNELMLYYEKIEESESLIGILVKPLIAKNLIASGRINDGEKIIEFFYEKLINYLDMLESIELFKAIGIGEETLDLKGFEEYITIMEIRLLDALKMLSRHKKVPAQIIDKFIRILNDLYDRLLDPTLKALIARFELRDSINKTIDTLASIHDSISKASIEEKKILYPAFLADLGEIVILHSSLEKTREFIENELIKDEFFCHNAKNLLKEFSRWAYIESLKSYPL